MAGRTGAHRDNLAVIDHIDVDLREIDPWKTKQRVLPLVQLHRPQPARLSGKQPIAVQFEFKKELRMVGHKVTQLDRLDQWCRNQVALLVDQEHAPDKRDLRAFRYILASSLQLA